MLDVFSLRKALEVNLTSTLITKKKKKRRRRRKKMESLPMPVKFLQWHRPLSLSPQQPLLECKQ
jgi:hypothetical protein